MVHWMCTTNIMIKLTDSTTISSDLFDCDVFSWWLKFLVSFVV